MTIDELHEETRQALARAMAELRDATGQRARDLEELIDRLSDRFADLGRQLREHHEQGSTTKEERS